MKNKLIHRKAYSKLIRKIFFQTLAILVAAIVTILFLRSAGRGYIGNSLSYIISIITGLSLDDAEMTYFYYIGANIDTIMMIATIVFFVILFRFSLTWFTKYFDEIVAGVDQLADESPDKITTSSELVFVEDKLNQVKDKLEKRAKEVEEAEQRKNDLVVYLAHDIKTPLTSVIGYLSLLDETRDMREEQKANYIHITLDKACRLENLINEFFEITRYNLQHIPLKKETIDLYYMLVQIADEAYPQLSINGKQVDIQVSEDMNIYGDSDKLARVFNNVLKNAIAYSGDNCVITIAAEQKDDFSLVKFENEGYIPREKLDFIFEKFYRLDDSRSTTTGGAGLGLAIAKDIVMLHNGKIWAECQDNRTIFTIKLPAR